MIYINLILHACVHSAVEWCKSGDPTHESVIHSIKRIFQINNQPTNMYCYPRWCAQAFSSCVVQASCYAGFSCCAARALGYMGPVIVALWFCCSTACGIFPDQGSKPCPLHWQAGSYPLCHQGSPIFSKYLIFSKTLQNIVA